MPEILQQIEKMSDKELEQLIVAARAQIEQRHEAPPISDAESQLLTTRALEAKRLGFPGRPAEDVLADLERVYAPDTLALQ